MWSNWTITIFALITFETTRLALYSKFNVNLSRVSWNLIFKMRKLFSIYPVCLCSTLTSPRNQTPQITFHFLMLETTSTSSNQCCILTLRPQATSHCLSNIFIFFHLVLSAMKDNNVKTTIVQLNNKSRIYHNSLIKSIAEWIPSLLTPLVTLFNPRSSVCFKF